MAKGKLCLQSCSWNSVPGLDSLDEWKLCQTTTATSEPTSIAVGNNGVWTRGAVSRWYHVWSNFNHHTMIKTIINMFLRMFMWWISNSLQCSNTGTLFFHQQCWLMWRFNVANRNTHLKSRFVSHHHHKAAVPLVPHSFNRNCFHKCCASGVCSVKLQNVFCWNQPTWTLQGVPKRW